jgi:putative ATP-dependent endonuclease of OLD family
MKISAIRIKNFRAYEDETVELHDYTCFVGPNGAGKSTVLTSLNVFFRETASANTDLLHLGREDFHANNTGAPVEISVTFKDLNAQAKEDLKAYVRQDKLTVSAVAKWDEGAQSAEVKQLGKRLGMKAFAEYYEREKNSTSKELQEFYNSKLREQFPDLPEAKTKPKMDAAMRDFEAAHPEMLELLDSEDNFYGIMGVGKLAPYLQWVNVPAVKDAGSETTEGKNTAIGKLLTRRVHAQLNLREPLETLRRETLQEYGALLAAHTIGLKTLSDSLTSRFRVWAHQSAALKLQWQQGLKSVIVNTPIAEVKAIEGLFQGDLVRFGHGLQRSFIFALLEEEAEHTDIGPRLILGCEEPELYQHPPQARHLASVLQKLTFNNSQVLVTTHSPYFVNSAKFETIRMAVKNSATGVAAVKRATLDRVSKSIAEAVGEPPVQPGGTAAKIIQEMEDGMSEMFFASFRVLVEGQEDIAFISSYLSLANQWDRFRSMGGHFVEVHGKSHLIHALAIANELGLPSFVVFDCDGDTPADQPGGTKTGRRDQQEKENLAIFRLSAHKYWRHIQARDRSGSPHGNQ